jgi:hypothetical protein
MFLMNRCLILAAVASIIIGCDSDPGSDDRPDDAVFGVWRAVSYEIQGIEHEQDGLIMIAPGFLMSNTVFNADGDSSLDANANSGPIRFEGNTIVIEQWMRLHWRTADTAGSFLDQGAVERIPYRLENNLLIFEFPSGNRYVAERLAHISSR